MDRARGNELTTLDLGFQGAGIRGCFSLHRPVEVALAAAWGEELVNVRVAADGEGGDMHCPCTYVGVPPASTAACTNAHVTARQLPPSPLACRVPHPLCAGVPRPPAAAGAAAHPRPEAAPSVPSTGSLPGLGARVAQPQPRQARGLHGCDLHYAPAPGLPRHLAAGERRGVGGCAGERRRRGGRRGP